MAGRSLNKVMLIGNLTRDPEMRYTPAGTAVTTFGLATNRSWKTDTGELRDEVEFHRIVAWNKLAELCSQLLAKGRKAYLEGRLQTRSFTGQDNLQHTIVEIVLEDMILLDSKRPDGLAREGEAGAVLPAPTASQPADQQAPASPPPPPAADDKKKTKKKTEGETSLPSSVSETKPNETVDPGDIPF